MGRLFVQDLVGVSVNGASGDVLARVQDIVARLAGHDAPVVSGLVVRATTESGRRFVPWNQLARFDADDMALVDDTLDSRPFERRPGEILLARDLRDREVVDITGLRVVRANDVALDPEGDRWHVAGVDISLGAMLSQLGLGRFARGRFTRRVLAWDSIEIFTGSVPVPLDLPHNRIAGLHPADIARLMHDLGYYQSAELLQSLPDDVAADVMESLSPEYQATLLASLDRERAADILDEMLPDAAADVLNDIVEENPDCARELVESMGVEEASEVAILRAYPDDTAGGLMTTEMVALPASFTAARAIEWLHEHRDDLPATLGPVLIVSEEGSRRLAGMVSLKALLLASPEDRLESLAESRVASLHVTDSALEVARTIAHYNLAALPILDEHEELAGVVSLNSAMDVVAPREWIHGKPASFIGGRPVA